MSGRDEQHPRVPRRHVNRARPNHSRLYQHLGVRDLREIIDRKRGERGHLNEPGVPPPDPSYNYLKDPTRENGERNIQDKQIHKQKCKHNVNNVMKPDRGASSNEPKHKDIENPLNIKIEFSTSTGEHSYKLDESTVLPTIKHVPDHKFVQNQSVRGRGRGRGRGPRSYQTRTIRNNRKAGNEAGFIKEFDSVQEGPTSLLIEGNWDDDLSGGKACEANCSNTHGEDFVEIDYEHHKRELNDKHSEQQDEISLEKQVANLRIDEVALDKAVDSKELDST